MSCVVWGGVRCAMCGVGRCEVCRVWCGEV